MHKRMKICALRKILWFSAGLFLAAPLLRAAEWELVWSDEFNNAGLPDTNKWGYEEGFIRNNESQYYTRARLENARVENGLLVIECRKDDFKPENHDPVKYTAASLTTLGRASWQYGRIEMRAKLPAGKGVWPAFWMMGTNITQVGWPRCGEIDIMEMVGKEPDFVHGTLHWSSPTTHKHDSDGGKFDAGKPLSDDFHIYAVEWFADRIDFYYDDHKYYSVPLNKASEGKDNPFRKPHYMILNFALGGNWGGPFSDDILPQKYLVDYVRVYKQKETGTTVPPK